MIGNFSPVYINRRRIPKWRTPSGKAAKKRFSLSAPSTSCVSSRDGNVPLRLASSVKFLSGGDSCLRPESHISLVVGKETAVPAKCLAWHGRPLSVFPRTVVWQLLIVREEASLGTDVILITGTNTVVRIVVHPDTPNFHQGVDIHLDCLRKRFYICFSSFLFPPYYFMITFFPFCIYTP